MDLPTVPAAAVDAAWHAADHTVAPDKIDVLGMLDAALPHLYAASLRRAADDLYRSWGDEKPPHWVESLREMADGATA